MTEQAQEQSAPENEPTRSEVPEGYVPQETVNKVVGERAKEAEQRAINRLLEQSGAESADALVSAYTEAQSVAEQLKSEEVKEVEQTYTEKLKAASGEAERYKGALQTFLEREREGVPEHITTLLDKMDPVDQLTYLSENKANLVPAEPERAPRRSPEANGGSKLPAGGVADHLARQIFGG